MLHGRTDHFSTDHLLASLSERAVGSAKWTLLAQLLKLVLQVMSIMVLARLLQPEDFGLVAMAMVVTVLLAPLTDGGLSAATIQRSEITQLQVSGLFWINCLMGTLLCLTLSASAPLLAFLYGEPRLLPVTIALSVTFLLSSVSLQSFALLRRQMRFRIIAAIGVVSTAAGIAIAILVALAGFGHWALVSMPLVTSGTASFLSIGLCGWVPGRPARNSGLRPLILFGLSVTGSALVGQASRSLTPFAVGLVGGAQQLGLFNRAQTIVSLTTSQFLPPIMSVVQPALARVAHDPDRFERALGSLLRKAFLPSVFISLIVAIHADWLVIVALGAEWTDAVPFIRLLAVFTLVEPVASMVAAAMVANGHPSALMRWHLISFAIIGISIGIGAIWGTTGIVAAFAISGVSFRLFGLLTYAARYLPMSACSMMNVFRPYALIVPIMVAGLLLGQQVLKEMSPLAALFISVLISLVLYMGLVMIITETRREAQGIFNLLIRRGGVSGL